MSPGPAEARARGSQPISRSPADRQGRSEHAGARRSRLDRESRVWLAALRPDDLRRDGAIRRLHATLLHEARHEVRRRASSLVHPSGGELDDLALQVTDDAVVTILARLDQFRGDSRFLTWARRITQHGVPSALTRSLEGSREFPIADGFEQGRMWPLQAYGPYELSAARESAEMLVRLMAEELTVRQCSVLIAIAVDGMEAGQLARQLGTNRGAIYKTLHDARRKLRARLRDRAQDAAPM